MLLCRLFQQQTPFKLDLHAFLYDGPDGSKSTPLFFYIFFSFFFFFFTKRTCSNGSIMGMDRIECKIRIYVLNYLKFSKMSRCESISYLEFDTRILCGILYDEKLMNAIYAYIAMVDTRNTWLVNLSGSRALMR